jgi:DNA-binding NarL/FixJ family response regulator
MPVPSAEPGVAPSQREIDCLAEYVATGNHKEAARNLHLAESTFKNHLVNLRAKLEVDTSIQLAFVMREVLARHPRLDSWTKP